MFCCVFASSPLLGGSLKAQLYFRDQNYTLLLTTKHYFCFFYCCPKKTFMAPPRKPHQTTPKRKPPSIPPDGGLPDTPLYSLYSLRTFAPLRALR